MRGFPVTILIPLGMCLAVVAALGAMERRERDKCEAAGGTFVQIQAGRGACFASAMIIQPKEAGR